MFLPGCKSGESIRDVIDDEKIILIHLLRGLQVSILAAWVDLGRWSRDAGDKPTVQNFLYLTFPDDDHMPPERF